MSRHIAGFSGPLVCSHHPSALQGSHLAASVQMTWARGHVTGRAPADHLNPPIGSGPSERPGKMGNTMVRLFP